MSPKNLLPATAPVRFEMDKRAFGLVHFPRAKGQTRIAMPALQNALETNLNVRIEAKRERLFGPKVHSFSYMGETVKLRMLDNGDACVDLGSIDDEVRETLLERLRQSHDFDWH